ncbi:hypothetical protein [Pseudomonas sp. NA-150]
MRNPIPLILNEHLYRCQCCYVTWSGPVCARELIHDPDSGDAEGDALQDI